LARPTSKPIEGGKEEKKAGALFLDITKPLNDGSDHMDWANKTTMKLGLMDIANIVCGVRQDNKASIVHKIERDGKDQFTSLTIEPGEGDTYKWLVCKKVDGTNKLDTIYMNSKEMYLVFQCLEAAIPAILDWIN
jgi:hypothetical protein